MPKRKDRAKRSVVFFLSRNRTLLFWNHDPHEHVHENTRNASWDERNDEAKPEPEGTDAEEFGKPATDSGNHTITP